MKIPGKTANRTLSGRMSEDQRHEHVDLLATGALDQTALGVFSRVERLRMQHVSQRRTAVDRRDELVDAAGHRGDARARRGQRRERLGQRRSGADGDDRAAKLAGELARADVAHPAHRVEDALARRQAQREELEDRGQLLLDPADPRCGRPA